MRIPTPQALSAVVALPLIVGCSGSLAIPPHLVPTDSVARSAMWRAPRVSALMAAVSVNSLGGPRQTSFNKCPATGPIKYVADSAFSVIHIYSGKFRYGAQCGLITAGSGGSGFTHSLRALCQDEHPRSVRRQHRTQRHHRVSQRTQIPVRYVHRSERPIPRGRHGRYRRHASRVQSKWIQLRTWVHLDLDSGAERWNFCRKFSDAGLS